MNLNALIFVGFMILSSAGFAETLLISGTVTDKGFTVSNRGAENEHITVNPKTELKIYVAEMKAEKKSDTPKSSRSPQSIVEKQNEQDQEQDQDSEKRARFGFSTHDNWKQLGENEKLSAPSYIRVEAP